MIRADKYLELFEKNVIIKGVESGLFKDNKIMVPVKNGGLDSTQFGKFLKNQLDYDGILVIDYYGLLKKSSGFTKKHTGLKDMEIKRLKANVVHFASIKIEDIAKLDKSLMVDFPGFKKYLVDLRGFKRS